jgi:hypothetical protein
MPTAQNRPNVVGLQERRLDRTILRTYRTKVDLDEVVPNANQPRSGPKEDDELQRQIEANEGLFEPLLVEPHPELPGNLGSLMVIGGGQTRAFWSNEGGSNIARFLLRSQTEHSQRRNGSGYGFTFIANGRNGKLRKRRWSRIASSI